MNKYMLTVIIWLFKNSIIYYLLRVGSHNEFNLEYGWMSHVLEFPLSAPNAGPRSYDKGRRLLNGLPYVFMRSCWQK